jgi:hypothetical protein
MWYVCLPVCILIEKGRHAVCVYVRERETVFEVRGRGVLGKSLIKGILAFNIKPGDIY